MVIVFDLNFGKYNEKKSPNSAHDNNNYKIKIKYKDTCDWKNYM